MKDHGNWRYRDGQGGSALGVGKKGDTQMDLGLTFGLDPCGWDQGQSIFFEDIFSYNTCIRLAYLDQIVRPMGALYGQRSTLGDQATRKRGQACKVGCHYAPREASKMSPSGFGHG